MSIKEPTIANVTSATGILAFLADFQVVLTSAVLITALVLNVKNILKKNKETDS